MVAGEPAVATARVGTGVLTCPGEQSSPGFDVW